MGEVSVSCPVCGQSLTAPNEDELAKTFKEHAHHDHGMEMSEEQAKMKVKGMATKSEGK
jgi:predicted small metal-binding protein